MADRNWRESKEIMTARRVCAELGQTAVVLVLVDDIEGEVKVASYGKDGRRCTWAGHLADHLLDKAIDWMASQ